MAEKYPFGTWIYNVLGDFTPDELDRWKECGISLSVTERTFYGKHNIADLIPFLDKAEKLDIKLVANIVGLTNYDILKMTDEEYEARFREVYGILGGHPALYGFYVGDEPGNREIMEASERCLRIQKKVAPELTPFMNISGHTPGFSEEVFGGKSFFNWMKDLSDELGHMSFSFSQYNQMVADEYIDMYYESIKAIVDAAKYTKIDIWGCFLLSAHYNFRVPTEYEIMWQITTGAALGCRGVFWFRLYDRAHGPNYHGTPIDEYGYKTEQFYKLLRCQRRFADHYGELLMSLRFKDAYFIGKQRATYPMFGYGTHDMVSEIRADRDGIVSFFEDENGKEYMCLVNADQNTNGVYKIFFDREKCDLIEVLFNGKQGSPYNFGNTKDHWDGQWLYPGQMCIYRIDRK